MTTPKTIFTGNACIRLDAIQCIRKGMDEYQPDGPKQYVIYIDRIGGGSVSCTYSDIDDRNHYYHEWCKEWAGKP